MGNKISKSSDILLLMDFDDTLFPTSYIKSIVELYENRKNDEDKDILIYLKTLIATYEKLLFKFLDNIIVHDVKIVTLSSNKWIYISSQEFMPKLYKFIKDNDIEVYQNDKQEVNKYNMFKNILNNNLHKKQVVLFTDAYNDYKDLYAACNNIKMPFKVFKFIESPRVETLSEQFKFVKNIFNKIIKFKNENIFLNLRCLQYVDDVDDIIVNTEFDTIADMKNYLNSVLSTTVYRNKENIDKIPVNENIELIEIIKKDNKKIVNIINNEKDIEKKEVKNEQKEVLSMGSSTSCEEEKKIYIYPTIDNGFCKSLIII